MITTGLPIWTWPEWRKAPTGLRIRHNDTGRYGTYIKPAKVRHDGARVRWDAYGSFGEVERNVVGAARDLTPVRIKAWDLIGFDGNAESISETLRDLIGPRQVRVRPKGGRAYYEGVSYEDSTGGENVRLFRLDVTEGGLHEVSRYISPDTELELVELAEEKEGATT